jgi:hypothetical protein
LIVTDNPKLTLFASMGALGLAWGPTFFDRPPGPEQRKARSAQQCCDAQCTRAAMLKFASPLRRFKGLLGPPIPLFECALRDWRETYPLLGFFAKRGLFSKRGTKRGIETPLKMRRGDEEAKGGTKLLIALVPTSSLPRTQFSLKQCRASSWRI